MLVIAPMFCDIDSNSTSPTFNFMRDFYSEFFNSIINIMTTAQDVRTVGYEYLPWMVIAPLAGVAAWMLDGIFIGATRTADMRNMMFISFCIYLIALAILLPKYGNHGLWASLIIFSLARGITLGFKYPRLEASVGPN